MATQPIIGDSFGMIYDRDAKDDEDEPEIDYTFYEKQTADCDKDCPGCTTTIRDGDEYWGNDDGDIICCDCYRFEKERAK